MVNNRLYKLAGSLERFIAKASGVSPTFRGLERKRQYRSFKRTLKIAILKQATTIATEDLIDRIKRELGKLSSKDAGHVRSVVRQHFKPMQQFVDTEDVFGYLVWSGEEGGKAAAKLLGAKGVFSLKNQDMLTHFRSRSNLLINSLDTGTLEDLSTTIADGVENDLTVSEIRSNIVSRFGTDIGPYRAEMIARTEFANAAIETAKETYTRNGVKRWRWLLSPDACDECTANDDQEREVGEVFSSGDTQPPVHPNCKCDITPLPDEDVDLTDAWLGE